MLEPCKEQTMIFIDEMTPFTEEQWEQLCERHKKEEDNER